MTEPMSDQRPIRKWKKRSADRYRAVFGDFQGNPTHGYTHEYWWLGDLRETWSEATRDGFRAQDSDDFNIGVVRSGQLVALLWMDEVVDDEEAVMAQVVASAGRPTDA